MIRFIPHSFLPCYFFFINSTRFSVIRVFFLFSIHFLNSYEVCGLHTSRSWSRRLARRIGSGSVGKKSRKVSFFLSAVALLRYTPLLAPIGLHLWPLVRWVKVISWLESKKTSFSRLWLVFVSLLPRAVLSRIYFNSEFSSSTSFSVAVLNVLFGRKRVIFFTLMRKKATSDGNEMLTLAGFNSILHPHLNALTSLDRFCTFFTAIGWNVWFRQPKSKNSTWKVSRVHTTFSFLIFSQQFCFSCPCKFTHSSIRISIFLH